MCLLRTKRGQIMRFEIIVSLFATMIISAILTPFVRRISFKVGAIDKPTARRVNKVPMPTWGDWQSSLPSISHYFSY